MLLKRSGELPQAQGGLSAGLIMALMKSICAQVVASEVGSADAKSRKGFLQPLAKVPVPGSGGLGKGPFVCFLPGMRALMAPSEPDLASAWIFLTWDPCFQLSPLDKAGQSSLEGPTVLCSQRDTSCPQYRDPNQSHLSQRAGGLS